MDDYGDLANTAARRTSTVAGLLGALTASPEPLEPVPLHELEGPGTNALDETEANDE